ncbi:hypothetical protein ZIOFF_042337 [Zingiber officinale]|uniref:GRAM domain-containing protein n=2 Tax=Zingiber officinale TaxID=94328 RepID=A0A8J5KVD4_ZINOF|nr:hypothetical protein ZIOFF_042337 [Zingiber officinale]
MGGGAMTAPENVLEGGNDFLEELNKDTNRVSEFGRPPPQGRERLPKPKLHRRSIDMDSTVAHAAKPVSDGSHAPEAASHANLQSEDDASPPPPPQAALLNSEDLRTLQQRNPDSHPTDLPKEALHAPAAAEVAPPESNPYIARSPAANSSSSKSTAETVKTVLKRWGKKLGESAKKAEDLSKNTWQHLNTGPSFVEATMGRIAQGTKVIAEGGYDKIFRQTFDTLPEEQLKKSYACYLSTSAGPVMGVLYLSTAKLAFCSDNPLSYKVEDKTEWSYYKVAIPLHQLKSANSSTSKKKPAEKYIQVVSVDNHEFWFMGFMHYDSAAKSLQDALHDAQNTEPVTTASTV